MQSTAAIRSIEGRNNLGIAAGIKRGEVQKTRRGPGRPVGSGSKATNLLGKQMAEELLGQIKPLLSDGEYKEIQDAIKKGKSVSTIQEAKIMLALMGPPLRKRLVDENRPARNSDIANEMGLEPEEPELRRDTNERLKIWTNILSLVDKMEKQSDEGTDTKSEPIFEIIARRGGDAGRIAILIGDEGGSMGGIRNGLGRQSDYIRAIPSQLPERFEYPEDSEQIETTRILDSDSDRVLSLSDNETEL